MPNVLDAAASIALSTLLVTGCAGDEGDDTDTPEFLPLITLDWTLEAGSEAYRCKTVTLEEDVVIAGFQQIAPPGTHHTTLTWGPPTRPDEEWDCLFTEEHPFSLTAAGVGTQDVLFPDGVGIRVPAGQQMLLNTHIFNASDGELAGTSGTSVLNVEEVEHEAGITIAAVLPLEIEPGNGQEQTGSCVVSSAGQAVFWWPHMHQLGRRMTVEVNGEVVHDEPYSFEAQTYYPTDIALAEGDVIDVTCTYDNPGDNSVLFGGSTTDEMCVLAIWRYPGAEALCGF